MQVSDETLVDENNLAARIVMDEKAFCILYDQYFPIIHKYIYFRVQNDVIADDLTGQVFEKIITNGGNYSPSRAPFRAWLFGITRHVVSEYFRNLQRTRWLSLDNYFNFRSDYPNPEEVSIRNEDTRNILNALSRLTNREKDLMGLKFSAGFTNREIAKITHLSESNVAVILYRALQKIRELLTLEESND